MGKTKGVNPLQKKLDAQYMNQSSKQIRKETNLDKAHGTFQPKIKKQGGNLPNLAVHK